MKRYLPKQIEPKWQRLWAQAGLYQTDQKSGQTKYYILEYFPYPSGSAMHVGHVRNYTIGDVMARHARMEGKNVMHPMGWDAFGLPAENYAIKNNISPAEAIRISVARFKQQLIQMGFSYDWSREINSTDPQYYRWTQWFFLMLHRRGLAYQKESLQWWCPVDKTVLANEQVEDGCCWRCHSPVEKKPLKQWFFKITDYADRLLEGLDGLDWSPALKNMQSNWIGRSEGLEIDFTVHGSTMKLKVFTTRPDTIYGATFLVLAPEHPAVEKLATVQQRAAVRAYAEKSIRRSEIERMDEDRPKTGVFSGAYAVHPLTGKTIPIWISDFVLVGYGTGAIMAVPANDQRDWQFAKKFDLPIIEIITDQDKSPKRLFGIEGTVVNSGSYDGLSSAEASQAIIKKLIDAKQARHKVHYKLHDWLISRQRYWGAPIPIIHCAKCGPVAVSEKDLPVKLPELEDYRPPGDGRSPLARAKRWVETTCPKCGQPARRETDTMDGFACSSWYFLRFADPHNDHAAFDPELARYWLPVDDYIGGAEHAVMHLLYARFWTKVMYDEKLIEFDEPFPSLKNQGMILGPDGAKMSKSRGNVIAPDDLIAQGYGADAIRLMELFIGPWDQSAAWSVDGISGTYRYLQRVWKLVLNWRELTRDQVIAEGGELLVSIAAHKAIKRVSEDLKRMNFNTAIAAMMTYVNQLNELWDKDEQKNTSSWQFAIDSLVVLLAPFAPHITEELWQELGHEASVHRQSWPKWESDLVKENLITVVVQVNGKLRSTLQLPADVDEEGMTQAAQDDPKVKAYLQKGRLVKTVTVPGKLVNFVVD